MREGLNGLARGGVAVLSLLLMISMGAQLESFDAPGFDEPITAIRYAPGEASSAMPLGGLGTGFVEIASSGALGNHVTDNEWLRPRPVATGSGVSLTIGDTTVNLADAALRAGSFWGHFPMADLFFQDAFPGASVHLRAFSPLIPHDYERSNMPVALFTLRVTNRGDKALPVRAALDWGMPAARVTSAEGNVEAAIGWRKATLEPGELWTVTPTILYAQTEEDLLSRAHRSVISDTFAEEREAPEGRAFSHGAIAEFLLDGFAGFNWEQHQRPSAVYDGEPTIGQIMWELRYDDARVGRGPNRGWGFAGDKLNAITEDGKIEVHVQVRGFGETGLAVVYSMKNVSDQALHDLHFGYAVNFDLGGMKGYADNRARLDTALGGVVVTGGTAPAAALVGEADTFFVGTWPTAHEAMLAGKLSPVIEDAVEPATTRSEHGIQIANDTASYAVGAVGAGWEPSAHTTEPWAIEAEASRTLEPGASGTVTLAVAWHSPQWRSSDGETLRHRYAATYAHAGAVLDDALPQAASIEAAIVEWQSRIFESDAPPLLHDAVVNGLYVMPRNSWWLDDGRFLQSESFTGCPITETLVCRFNGSFPLALLWPECEKATMAEFIRTQADSGQIAFGFGQPLGSRTPMFHLQQPIVSTEFVLMVWRNYVLWQDRAYLEASYPALKSAMQFALTLDTDGDGLVNEAPGSSEGFPANQYYDVWPWWGTSAYTGSISLAALHAAHRAAMEVDDDGFVQETDALLKRASKAFDELLWTGAYYRLYNDPAHGRTSETSLTNALAGQWFACASGLGTILPKERIDGTIDTVLRLNDPATAYGAVNGVMPDGTIDRSFETHSAALTIGEVWNFCAMAAAAGRTAEAIALFDESYRNLALEQGSPWNIPWSMNPETGAIQWGIHYYSNPCVWTLFQAIVPDTYAELGRLR